MTRHTPDDNLGVIRARRRGWRPVAILASLLIFAAPLRAVTIEEANQFRSDILSAAESYAAIGTLNGDDRVQNMANLMRWSLEVMPQEDLVLFLGQQEGLIEGAAMARASTDQLYAAVLEDSAAGRLSRSAGLPGVSFSSRCPSGTPGANTGTRRDALIAANVFRGILAAAKWPCLQEFGVFLLFVTVSFNAALACLPLSIGQTVAYSVYEQYELCAADQANSYLESLRQRQNHTHTDMITFETDLDAALTAVAGLSTTITDIRDRSQNMRDTTIAHHATFDTRMDNVAGAVTGATTQLNARASVIDAALIGHDSNFTTRAINLNGSMAFLATDFDTRADTIDNQLVLLGGTVVTTGGTQEDLFRRLEIERALSTINSGAAITFQLPNGVGGYIELARDITLQTINESTAAGFLINEANTYLARGDTALAALDYKEAFRNYRKAYRDAVKGSE